AAGRTGQYESAKRARGDVPQGTRGRTQLGSRLRLVQPRRGARRRQGESGIARCVANHDTAGSFAGARDGASLRGLELPELRVLKLVLMVRSASSHVSNHEAPGVSSFETRRTPLPEGESRFAALTTGSATAPGVRRPARP